MGQGIRGVGWVAGGVSGARAADKEQRALSERGGPRMSVERVLELVIA